MTSKSSQASMLAFALMFPTVQEFPEIIKKVYGCMELGMKGWGNGGMATSWDGGIEGGMEGMDGLMDW